MADQKAHIQFDRGGITGRSGYRSGEGWIDVLSHGPVGRPGFGTNPGWSRPKDGRASVNEHVRELRARLSQGTELKPEFEYELLAMFVRNELSARVTVPLLWPVLTVVLVTMLINVLKVFDIVISIAPGSVQDDASVLALGMWRTAFGGANDFGVGSAIAVFIFLLVIPILLLNIRNFRREQ